MKSNMAMQAALIFLMVSLTNCTNIGLLDQLENPGGKAASTCGTNCRIFTTGSTYQGNMGGIAGADNICNNDPARPQSTTNWKAMLGSTSERIACTSPDCTAGEAAENLDWALRPNTAYRRVDGVLIGNTTGSAIFVLPLLETIDTVGFFVWTGMTGSWQLSSACQNGVTLKNWSIADSTLGATGDSSFKTTIVLFSTNSNCSTGQRLYCAEQ